MGGAQSVPGVLAAHGPSSRQGSIGPAPCTLQQRIAESGDRGSKVTRWLKPCCGPKPSRAGSQVAALAPKIEALEASWNRLRAISGGETPEQVVRYWEGALCP
jgi:hypothetical protein